MARFSLKMTLVVSTFFTGPVFAQGVQECATGFFQPDPPMFRQQGRIFNFSDLDQNFQTQVQQFESMPSQNPNFDFDPSFRMLTTITPEDGGPENRYLNPRHPGAQPNTPLPEWRRVRCVEQIPEPKPEDMVKPDGSPAARPLPFQWVRQNGAPNDRGAAFAAGYLRTLPQVKAAPFIRTTYVETGPSLFPDMADLNDDGEPVRVNSFATPPGTNMLPTVLANLRDRNGDEMLNTLPSTKARPYNLHKYEPRAVVINPASPSTDLRYILEELGEIVLGEPYLQLVARPERLTVKALKEKADNAPSRLEINNKLVDHQIQWALDIINGNDGVDTLIPSDRGYMGFPLFNHSGHKRVNRVLPVLDESGKVIGAETTVRQVWYDGNIKSDTMYFDFGWKRLGDEVDFVNCGGKNQPSEETCKSAAPIPPELPWTVNYEINVLNRGHDDFSPMVMQLDCPFKLTVGGEVKAAMEVKDADGNVVQENMPCPAPAGSSSQLIKRSTDTAGAGDAAVNENGWPEVTWAGGPLYASFDESFFPMQDGTKVSIGINMAPPQYFNLTYTWGWRRHPPRLQATENAHKIVPPPLPFAPKIQMFCHPLDADIVSHEQWAFEGVPEGTTPPGLWSPSNPEQQKQCLAALRDTLDNPDLTPEQAMTIRRNMLGKIYGEAGSVANPIDKISDLSPVKRMWRAFSAMQKARTSKTVTGEQWLKMLLDARNAYLDWQNRTSLPSGVAPDPEADVTLLFVNNNIYGHVADGGVVRMPHWRQRGDLVKVTLLNGDYFPHAYLNVDFGGGRGWENLFQPTLKTAGSGPWFTFGRFHARFNTVPGSIVTDAATIGDKIRPELEAAGAPDQVTPGVHRVMIRMNFEPSPRLRMYQFDPLHHDAAIYSLH